MLHQVDFDCSDFAKDVCQPPLLVAEAFKRSSLRYFAFLSNYCPTIAEGVLADAEFNRATKNRFCFGWSEGVRYSAAAANNPHFVMWTPQACHFAIQQATFELGRSWPSGDSVTMSKHGIAWAWFLPEGFTQAVRYRLGASPAIADDAEGSVEGGPR